MLEEVTVGRETVARETVVGGAQVVTVVVEAVVVVVSEVTTAGGEEETGASDGKTSGLFLLLNGLMGLIGTTLGVPGIPDMIGVTAAFMGFTAEVPDTTEDPGVPCCCNFCWCCCASCAAC